MNEMKIWTLEGSHATPLESIDRMESEWDLESTLVSNPNLLMDGLTLIGRQTPTEGGPLDLLGVDEYGRLCVFELKRGVVARDAVAQVIDYASDLDGMGLSELAEYISPNPGADGVDAIKDFRAWYVRKFDMELDGLKPIRMFLVGLGADDTTERMVKFLAANGVDISMLTFHGFAHAGKTLLAKQVGIEGGAASERARAARRPGQTQTLEGLRQMADGYGMLEPFDSAVGMFQDAWGDGWYGETPLQSSLRIDVDTRMAVSQRPYARVDVYEDMWINFHQRAFTLCEDAFETALKNMEYQLSPQSQEDWRNATFIQFPLNANDWERHKATLTSLAKAVYAAWEAGGADEPDSAG